MKIKINKLSDKVKSLKRINRQYYSKIYRYNIVNTKNNLSKVTPIMNSPKKSNSDSLILKIRKGRYANGYRHTHANKMFALSLWHASPKCYRLLYSYFALPSIITLRRSIRMIQMQPGFHSIILDALREKTKKFTMTESLVVVAFDEMSIKMNLEYNSRLDKVIGYEDMGEDRSDLIATYVTVFMVKSLLGKWKQPIGYFYTSGPMKTDMVKNKLMECIDILHGCNLYVKVVICDQGPNNRGCCKLLNLSTDSYFKYNNSKIYFFYDPPHLIKSIRNALYNKGFGDISFKYIKDIYNIKRRLSLQLKDKLTTKHIELSSFSKMRVNLATQVLSMSVASNIRTVVILSKLLPEDSLKTADFCEYFNNLFDIFNSKSNDHYVYKNPLNQNSKSMDFLRLANEMLNEFKCAYNGNDNLPCILGWIANVKALISLSQDLVDKYAIYELNTGNINQDYVENFFSRMRSGGGNRDNPSAAEFSTEYIKVCISELFNKIDGSNCELDAGEFLIKMEELKNIPHIKPLKTLPVILTENLRNLDIIETNAATVLAEDIAISNLRQYPCQACSILMLEDGSASFAAEYVACMQQKKNSSKEYSNVPTKSFLEYIKILETVYHNNIEIILHEDNVCTHFMNLVNEKTMFDYCKECAIMRPTYVILCFINIKFKSLLSKDNLCYIADPTRTCRKMLTLKHI